MPPKFFAPPYAKWLLLLLAVVVIFGLSRALRLEELVRYTNDEVYLTRYASIVVPGGGVYGYPPGTKFKVDPTHHSTLDRVFVTDGSHQLAIAPDALTHDPDRARMLADIDQRGQMMSTTALTAEKLRLQKAERDAQFSRARDIDLLNAKQHSGAPYIPPPPTPTPTPVRIQPAVR